MDAAGRRLRAILQKHRTGILEYLAGVFPDFVLDVCSGLDGDSGCRRRRSGRINPAIDGRPGACSTGPADGGVFYDYHGLSGRLFCGLFGDEYFAKVQFKDNPLGGGHYFDTGCPGFSDGTV